MHCFLLQCSMISYFVVFFFNDTAPTEIYTLSLHDALPILFATSPLAAMRSAPTITRSTSPRLMRSPALESERSEEHTSELQSQSNLVCRLLLEKKKPKKTHKPNTTRTTKQTATLLETHYSQ